MAAIKPGKGASIATLITVCLVFFIDIANIGMANIALPTIQQKLGYDDGSLQWILTAYSLTFGGFLMAGGRLGDIFGHKNVLIFGMTLFNIATLVCALVNDKIGLVVARAFQGLAAAFTIPAAQSLVALSFEDPDTRIKAFGAWGAAGSTGFVFGPIIGGLFTSLVTWEWIFWLSLIVEGALEIAALALYFTQNLPNPTSSESDTKNKWSTLHIRLDIFGTLVSVSSLILLVYGLTAGNINGWHTPDVIATLVTSVCLLAAFIFLEVKVSQDPILPGYMFEDRMFLNVGGAVLGVAVLTVITDAVTSNKGGKQDPDALLEGYRAGYYGAIAMSAIGFILAFFFPAKKVKAVEKPTEGSPTETPPTQGALSESPGQSE
ncbi:hypothetical protein G7Z17_g2661 [Cylindrodendrum hubeiense]|uniref:Major facilitator superfamily (MFS) profile domain-containing protein n=1 Tax=Cylindrodendrum hubeiense TaxID=595255 RepID=A0A9P5HG34_9HYPO|nr:hypothetical protein G7Z17_g2661 [Cylindrodendrum hubeiense]